MIKRISIVLGIGLLVLGVSYASTSLRKNRNSIAPLAPLDQSTVCLQDVNGSNRIQIGLATGEYQFTACNDNLTLNGTGTLSIKGCTFTLQHNSSDRRVLVTFDTCLKRGVATVQTFSPARIFTISDTSIGTTCGTASWSEQQITLTLSPGETVSKDVTFMIGHNAPKVEAMITPSISQYISVQPSNFFNVLASQPQSMHLYFSVPLNSAEGTYEGAIQLKLAGCTLLQPLRITLNVWPNFVDNSLGFTVKYPPASIVSRPDSNTIVFSSPDINPLEESPNLSIEIKPNPDNKNIFDFYKGPSQRDLLIQSEGMYTTSSINGFTYFVFNPVITFTGDRIIIIPRNGYFVEITDTSNSFNGQTGLSDLMISTLKFQ